MKKGIYEHKSGRKYLVYENGTVINIKTGKEQKISLKSNGYFQCSAGSIHRILANVFIENDDPINKEDVNHIDGNKQNNSLLNLEWVTRSQNIKHAFDNNLNHRSNNYQGGNKKKVACYDKKDNLIKTYDTIKDAKNDSKLSFKELMRCLEQQILCKNERKWRYL